MADEKNPDLYDLRGVAEREGGMCDMVIFANGTRVIQRFSRPMLFVDYDAQNLGPIIDRFLGAIKEAGFTPVINMPRRQISKEKRDALITRAIHVYRSMTEQKKPPAVIAQHVVDSVLSAID